MDQFNDQQEQTYYQQPVHVQPHRATTILILGILGFVCCGICSVLAWIFGNEDLKKMDAGQMDISGYDTTKIGRLLGIIGTILWIIGIAVYGLLGGMAALSSFI